MDYFLLAFLISLIPLYYFFPVQKILQPLPEGKYTRPFSVLFFPWVLSTPCTFRHSYAI